MGMAFDWEKAANLIKLHKPKTAKAGLNGDFYCTSGNIYEDGKIITGKECGAFLASKHAIPELYLFDDHGNVYTYACFKTIENQNISHFVDLYWPQNARNILEDPNPNPENIDMIYWSPI